MKEPNVALRLIICIGLAVIIALPAYYYFIHIVPAPKKAVEMSANNKVGEAKEARVASETLPPALVESVTEKTEAPRDLIHVDVYICNPVPDPENAEYSRCDVGFADQGIEMFSISKKIEASVLDEKVEQIMKDIPVIPEGDTRFTCISAKELREGDGEMQYVFIPDYSDKPAPIGNLRSSEVTSTNRCMEGYTEHKGIFTGTVPEGYHAYNYLTPPKGDPNYRIIY